MGICGNNAKQMPKSEINKKIGMRGSKEINKESVPSNKAGPTAIIEINELVSYGSPAMCKISCKSLENGKLIDAFGSGFFCKIDDNNIPFKKALFTNNHVLNKSSIKINKDIIFDYCGKSNRINITEDRRVFTNEELDYTCIEIFDKDNINNFFLIDDTIIKNKSSLKDKEIFILQYPNGGELAQDCGKIMDIDNDNNIIKHSVATEKGSSGSPLIKRHFINLVIGIHLGGEKVKKSENMYNIATPFDVIIKDIKNQLSYNKKNNTTNIIKYRNKINLIYEKCNIDHFSHNPNQIFGTKFVQNNKDNIILKINGKESKLVEEYDLKNGVNNIEINLINKLTNLEDMFYDACSLKGIEELKYLNITEINNFSRMFCHCSSLSDIKPLQNWNVSNGNNFSIFQICSMDVHHYQI